jgi:deoxyribose-phosphate aldolase
MNPEYRAIAKVIDHSLLRPTLTDAELEHGCLLARKYDVASVCIVPHALARSVELLAGSSVQPSTTVGFPHGANSTRSKVQEAEQAISDGGTELDMVVNVGKVLARDFAYVKSEIAAVLAVTRGSGQKLKVIFENCYLERAHKIALCEICSELAVDWVKTSTGFGSGGATLEDVKLMLDHVAPFVQVKAAGGVRTLSAVLELRELGVSRVGSSNTELILDELATRFSPAQK